MRKEDGNNWFNCIILWLEVIFGILFKMFDLSDYNLDMKI